MPAFESSSDTVDSLIEAAPLPITLMVDQDGEPSTSARLRITLPAAGVHTVTITWTNGGETPASTTAPIDADNGTFFTLIEGLLPGHYEFSVSPTGPDTSLSPSASASVDVPYPPPPPQGLTLDSASDSGASSHDAVTSVRAPVLTLRAVAGAEIALHDQNGVALTGEAVQGNAADPPAGDGLVAYTFTPSDGLPDGLYTVSATATVGVQASQASAPFTFEIDTIPPDVAITGATRTDAATETLTGTAGATASKAETPTVVLYRGSETKPVATATVSADGTWVSTPIAIGSGADSFRAVATDLAGNTASSAAYTPTLAPVITDPPPRVSTPSVTPATSTASPSVAARVTAIVPLASLPIVPVAASGSAATPRSDPPAAGPIVLGVPANRSVAAAIPAPSLAFDATVSVEAPNKVQMTGTASAPNGIASVELFEGDTDLGPATLDPATGAWSFTFSNGPGFHTGLTAVATARDGSTASAWSGYDLTTGVRGEPYATVQDRYDPERGTFLGQTFFKAQGATYLTTAYTGNADGSITTFYSSGRFFDDKSYYAYAETSDQAGTLLQDTYYNNDGTQDVHGYAPDQLLQSGGSEAGGGSTAFSFSHGFGHDTIAQFVLGGPDHDTLDLPIGSRGHIGAILAGATDGPEGVTLHLGAHDSVTIDGVTAAQLQAHRRDITVHA